ncbi:MAG TPA: hypothetical protein PL073_11570 [Spirochaetota bacterium]|nr:hypothetical protein [Spirochaetota bacterium]
MNIPFTFEAMIAFGWMSIMLLLGIILRAKVKAFQRFLIPSCLIGGAIGLILRSYEIIPLSADILETLAFHLFNISFISIGLTYNKEKTDDKGLSEVLHGSIWMGNIGGCSFALQAIVGGLCVIVLNYFGYNLFHSFGFLTPLGFEEGPGQALSVGKVWENLGYAHSATLGLTFAVAGYMFSFFIGVPLAYLGIRRGKAVHTPKELSMEIRRGIMAQQSEKEVAGELTTHSSNVDALAFQVSLVGVVYLITYVAIYGIGSLLSPEMGQMLWGFFFFIGLLIAFIVRFIITKFGGLYLIDPGIQHRITGFSVDYLLVATVMAIQVVVVWQYIVPIVVICVLAGIITTIVCYYYGRRLWSLNLERMLLIYGTVTGTVSTGLLLLRIADPEFRTTAAIEAGVMSIFNAPYILFGTILVSAPILWGWSIVKTIIVFAGMFIVAATIIELQRYLLLKKRKQLHS